MQIITDDRVVAKTVLGSDPGWEITDKVKFSKDILKITSVLFSGTDLFLAMVPEIKDWPLLMITAHAPRSQFDAVNELIRAGIYIPDRFLCIADRGQKFRGFHDRHWVCQSGNLHLTVVFRPGREIVRFESGFLILPAVAIAQTLSTYASLRDRLSLKWVNDILIEGAKVGGVIAQTSVLGREVNSAVLGIGLNVKCIPQIPADKFVPEVTALCEYGEVTINHIFIDLLTRLEENYGQLYKGHYLKLLDRYRSFFRLTGRNAVVYEDLAADKEKILARGIIDHIGDDLELYFQGNPVGIYKGRLALDQSV